MGALMRRYRRGDVLPDQARMRRTPIARVAYASIASTPPMISDSSVVIWL